MDTTNEAPHRQAINDRKEILSFDTYSPRIC